MEPKLASNPGFGKDKICPSDLLHYRLKGREFLDFVGRRLFALRQTCFGELGSL